MCPASARRAGTSIGTSGMSTRTSGRVVLAMRGFHNVVVHRWPVKKNPPLSCLAPPPRQFNGVFIPPLRAMTKVEETKPSARQYPYVKRGFGFASLIPAPPELEPSRANNHHGCHASVR